jgi:phospholipid/cholesterol/gamma-HCH transport system substrate-binding protein
MHSRTTRFRDLAVGLVVLSALAGLLALLRVASDGPGFLAAQKTVDVIFKDGQGIRVGSPVRVAGLDAGNVVDLDLVEIEGNLRARVRISLPASLLKRLRQDVKVSITPGLTGMSHVSIVASGKSGVALSAGQTISGIESSFFDPIIEQVGLGPVERSHLSHTIAEVRQTVDTIGPRLREMLTAFQQASGNLKELSDAVRPTVEATVGHVEELSRRINASGPKIDATLARLEAISRLVELILGENRESIRVSLTSVRGLTGTLNDVAAKDRMKVEKLLDGLDMTRARLDRVLYQADIIAGQGVQILARSRSEIERSVTNVRDTTDWGNKLVQKIYTNPFVLSPFYKPSSEDLRVQAVYDTAQVFAKGAQELNDAIKTLEAVQLQVKTPEQQQEVLQLQQKALALTERLGQTSALLAEGLRRPVDASRRRR